MTAGRILLGLTQSPWVPEPWRTLRPVLHWWQTGFRPEKVSKNWKARNVKKRRVDELLRETAGELAEGNKLLTEKKQAKKKAKSKLARKNAERSAELIEETVKSIAAHRKLLKREAADDPSGKSSPD